MKNLIDTLDRFEQFSDDLPFSTSTMLHLMARPPQAKYLLVIILSDIQLDDGDILKAGKFIILLDIFEQHKSILPELFECKVMVIEFETSDFEYFVIPQCPEKKQFEGYLTTELETCLVHFVEYTANYPTEVWASRRIELLSLLNRQSLGADLSVAASSTASYKVQTLLCKNIQKRINIDFICRHLNISISKLSRQLRQENTSFKELKYQVKLRFGLHLFLSTDRSVQSIAALCGYRTSKFIELFKLRFGFTPTNNFQTLTNQLP